MNKIKFLLIFAVLLIWTIFLGGEIPYLLIYSTVLFIIFSLIHSLISLIGLRGSIVFADEQIVLGEPVQFVCEVYNAMPFSIPYLAINNSQIQFMENEPKPVLSLSGKKSYKYTMTATPERRGYFEMGEIELVVQDIFKLFTFKKRFSAENPVLVYPKINQLSSFVLENGEHQGKFRSVVEMLEDRSQINTLREYVEGDALSSIHWKLSAKSENPIVKVYDYNIDPSVLFFMDNSLQALENDIDYRLEDKLVDVVLSLIYYYLGKNIPFTLFYQNAESYMETKSRDVGVIDDYLNILARIEANGSTTLEQVLFLQNEIIRDGSTVVIVTSRLNKEVLVNIVALTNISISPIIILIEDKEYSHEKVDKEALNILSENNVPYYRLDYSINTKNILEARYE